VGEGFKVADLGFAEPVEVAAEEGVDGFEEVDCQRGGEVGIADILGITCGAEGFLGLVVDMDCEIGERLVGGLGGQMGGCGGCGGGKGGKYGYSPKKHVSSPRLQISK